MPTNTYSCLECGFKEEYIEGAQISKENWHPEVCPKCEKGKLEKTFDLAGNSIGIDFVGPGFYINDSGKHNWRKGKTKEQISKVLANQADPY
jgi:predicted nucleic acid-binding Zn ribbon protein